MGDKSQKAGLIESLSESVKAMAVLAVTGFAPAPLPRRKETAEEWTVVPTTFAALPDKDDDKKIGALFNHDEIEKLKKDHPQQPVRAIINKDGKIMALHYEIPDAEAEIYTSAIGGPSALIFKGDKLQLSGKGSPELPLPTPSALTGSLASLTVINESALKVDLTGWSGKDKGGPKFGGGRAEHLTMWIERMQGSGTIETLIGKDTTHVKVSGNQDFNKTVVVSMPHQVAGTAKAGEVGVDFDKDITIDDVAINPGLELPRGKGTLDIVVEGGAKSVPFYDEKGIEKKAADIADDVKAEAKTAAAKDKPPVPEKKGKGR